MNQHDWNFHLCISLFVIFIVSIELHLKMLTIVKKKQQQSLGPKKRFYFFLLSMRFVSLMEIITSNSIRVWEEEVETSKNCFIIIILFSFDSQIIFEFLSNDMQNTLFVPFQPTKNLGWERVELYQLKTICGCRFHSFKILVKKFQTFILWRLE